MDHLPKNIIINYIFSKFKRAKVIKDGQEVHAECAICGDSKRKPGKKKRFHYNLETNVWHCFNCDASGKGLVSLVSETEKISYSDALKKFKYFFLNNINFKKNNNSKKENNKSNFDTEFFLKDCCFRITDKVVSIVKNKLKNRAIKELEKRNVSVNSYPFFICYKTYENNQKEKFDFSNRLIIPYFNKNKVEYIQGLRLSKNTLPKYKNAPLPKQDVILNKDNIHPEKKLFVFEGFWEALILDHYCNLNATTSLGADISKNLLKKYLELTNKKIVLCFDNDERGRLALLKSIKEFKEFQKRLDFLVWKQNHKVKDLGKIWEKKPNPNIIRKFLEKNCHSLLETKVLLSLMK